MSDVNDNILQPFNSTIGERCLVIYPSIKSTKTASEGDKKIKTYESRDSLVVTHPTTNRPASGLSTAERTGSSVFHFLRSYVLVFYRDRFI